jgi:hypothetical protein
MINIISILYMGTNINKLVPLPPAQIKYSEAAQHLFVNDQHNDEY